MTVSCTRKRCAIPMDEKRANEIINQAIDVAFRKGVYSLEEATHIVEAVSVINNSVLERNS
jgi:hypothetical protein